jgi:hypothetical protein
MPLVFVHGVNTRRGETPEEQKVFDNRMALLGRQFGSAAFAERVSAPDGLRAFTPYWGDLGVTFARNLACLPQTGVQSLTVGEPEAASLIEATTATLDADLLKQPGLDTAPLLTLARTRSLGAAVDLLFAGAANAPLPGLLFDEAAIQEVLPDAARFADAAERYAAASPKPAWLSDMADDNAFLDRLVAEVGTLAETPPGAPGAGGTSVQSLGFGDTLKSWLENAGTAVRNAVGSVVSAAVEVTTPGVREGFVRFSGFARPTASALIGRFFGDVFTYMENRQPIIDRVMADVDGAVAAKRASDSELYLVGYSFGGIILYDILTHFRPDLECDLLVTVGSQVALFAEIGRLADKEKISAAFGAGPTSLAARPPKTKRWLNVFDSTDFIGFGTRGVFSGVRDFRFETDALPLVSHGAYFETPRFFARLRERVREAFQNGTDTP